MPAGELPTEPKSILRILGTLLERRNQVIGRSLIGRVRTARIDNLAINAQFDTPLLKFDSEIGRVRRVFLILANRRRGIEEQTGWRPQYSFQDSVEFLLNHCRKRVAAEKRALL